MKITRSPGIGKYRQICTHAVHLTEVNTLTRRRRIYEAQRKGHDPAICGTPSMYVVDEQPRCQRHAGQDAVEYLLAHGSAS